VWNHQRVHTKAAWLHAKRRIKGSEVGTVIQRERVVRFKAYRFILSCIFTSKPLSMQIRLVWTVDSPITSYFWFLLFFHSYCTLLFHEHGHNKCYVHVYVYVYVFGFFCLFASLGAGGFECACMTECLAVSASVFALKYGRRYAFARHMALSCPGTVLDSPDVLLF